ncbi:reverse transcriptase family protein [Thalassolituus oleivorans]|uniref:reverse transcriptase family protein n=1 Tax=Thalassolituus oleivorans TaxID=187493 RepID=UPI0023F43A69|nr:reverse transcriptase family protein [Thalassolituus oleivorans]
MTVRDIHRISTVRVISGIASLSKALDLDESELEKAALLVEKYTIKEKKKIDGSARTVHSPCKLIRKVQTRIKNRIFRDPNIIEWGSFIFGSIPNGNDIPRDYVSCARQHCGAKSLLKLDISSFFDNIHSDLVNAIFLNFFHFDSDVADLLTEICTYQGRLPQGGITSSYLASLALYDVECAVVRRLFKKELVYTRYVDDITVSSKIFNYDYSYPMRIIQDMLYKKDLPMHPEKTVIERLGTEGLTVHGLRVHHDTVRLPREEARKIRANVKRVEELSKEPCYRTSFAYRRDFNRCMGRVNKLERVGHNQSSVLVKRLNNVQPLPSLKDITRCKDVVKRLARDYLTLGHTHSYRTRFYRCHERLNILSRSFEVIAADLRLKLKPIKPPEKIK